MSGAINMVNIWRGDLLESSHMGHAVICDGTGQIVESWGAPETIIYPRSSCKMLQALPLIESGAAAAYGLGDSQLALACSSHQGADFHTNAVQEWLKSLNLAESDLRCGSHEPYDKAARNGLIKTDKTPCQFHNNCSGKHSGFLTLNKYLSGDSEYTALDHPVQKAVKAAFEDLTQETSSGYGIDGCSAPNFTSSLHGLARAMAFFANSDGTGDARDRAAYRLTSAMRQHPDMVAGEGRACSELMHAMSGRVAVKTGAEAVFVAIVPELRLGIALKIIDGGTRAAEAAITAILCKIGVLKHTHFAAVRRLQGDHKNCNGLITGKTRLDPNFIAL